MFNSKAKKWVEGRKGIFQKLEAAIPAADKVIWMHCASLGEFEQGRPLIEVLKKDYPAYKILLTFFSPSGYEVRKNYEGADWIFYLPVDGPRHAKRFLEIAHPSLVIFVKYEFWYYYLKKIKYRNIPLLLVSALFRKDMSFFKWYGGIQRKILSRFDHLFVQNENSLQLLRGIGLGNIATVSGDTRFDRVAQIAGQFEPVPLIEKFIGDAKTIVAGSTWMEDEELLKETIPFLSFNKIKLVIAPHEIDPKNIEYVRQIFPDSVLLSQMQSGGMPPGNTPCLIIDNVGMLARLYKYGYCCYVGGGFTKSGVHNVLEAAVYGKPVLMGPNYQRYYEAVELINTGGGCAVKDKNEFIKRLNDFIIDPVLYNSYSASSHSFAENNRGAVKKITSYIQENRLLTN